MSYRTNRLGSLSAGIAEERRLHMSLMLNQLTVADGAWLEHALPALLGRARPQYGAVRLEDVMLRYRPGRLGVADAMDATAKLLQPFAAAGAELEHRSEWYIADDDDDDESDGRSHQLDAAPDQDLIVSVRVVVDATAEDGGAAALWWATLALERN